MNIISYLLSPVYLFNPINYVIPYVTPYNKLIKKPKLDNIKYMKLILLNMDGLLRNSNKPIIIAKESFNYYREYNNKTQICIITNESRKTSKTIKKELIIMGYNMFNIKLISASTIIKNYIEELIILNKDITTINKPLRFSLVVEESIYFYIKDNLYNKYQNIEFIWLFDKNKQIKNKENLTKIEDNKETNNFIDYFIIGSIDNDNPDKLFNIKNKLLEQVKSNQTAKFILMCPDVKKVEVTLLLPSYILSIINKSLYLNIKAYCPNKPESKYIKKEIRALYNIDIDSDNKNIIMIGDNINTDIEMGKNLNIQTGLVLSGTTNINDLNYKNTLGINYIVPDLSYFLY